MLWKMMFLGAAMLVTACVPTGGNSCAGWKPIRLADASIDGLTDQDAAEVLAHNEFWRAQCE